MSLRIALAASLVSLCFACGARTELDGFDSDGGGGSGGTKKQPESCKEQGITYIYVVLTDKRIYAFDPPTATFKLRGVLDCPDSNNAFSMAVNRKGIAFVEFDTPQVGITGNIFRVDTKNGHCTPTSYVPEDSCTSYGMGFVADANDGGEELFLASSKQVLATLDTDTFERTEIGTFSSPIGEAELTGTGDGKLFAFGVDTTGNHLAQVDPKTAKVLADKVVTVGEGTHDWAFANWGSDFYFFTSKNGLESIVTKYAPSTHQLKVVATAPGLIVGSGVSTCAPL
jgi:hypothetical protein